MTRDEKCFVNDNISMMEAIMRGEEVREPDLGLKELKEVCQVGKGGSQKAKAV